MKPVTDYNILLRYREEMEVELRSILSYWKSTTPDRELGGFFGAVSNDDRPHPGAAKGIVLNSRILWTCSAATRNGMDDMKPFADRAYRYMCDHFYDRQFGGVYWSVTAEGEPLQTRKQIYGLAFCIYGLAEYYQITKNESVLRFATEPFGLIERHSYQPAANGYVEALSRDWQQLDDLRLSEKDANEAFSMNTHLHIIEAYANLFSVWKSEELKACILNLLSIFEDKIIDPVSGHLYLFMNEAWEVKSESYSFGHDIEASWLLYECAVRVGDAAYINRFKKLALTLAEAAVEGLAGDGALYQEYEARTQKMLQEKHWWPQAEAMVGFFNVWQMTQQQVWLERSLQSWDFVKKHLKSRTGEWYWGLDEFGNIMQQDKAGFWKCPYHNARACMEIIRRIDECTALKLA